MIAKIKDVFQISFISAACILLLINCFVASGQNAPVAKITAAEWQADINFLATAMPKQHPNLFRRMKREDFEAAVKALDDQIPSMNEDEIIVGLMRIMSMVRDGHTGVFPREFFRTGIYPLRFYFYQDGLFVQKAAPGYADAVGGRVVKIGNIAAEDALKQVSRIASADNEIGAKENAPILMSIPEILAGLNINNDKQNLKLIIETDGKEKIFQIRPSANLEELLQPPAGWIDAARKTDLPLYKRDPKNLYWFEYLKDQKLIYVQENAVQNKPDETVVAFYKRVFDFVAANPVEKFVLDLRNNDGGNNGLNRQVVIDIIKSKIDERGKFFVITGRRTFSAAQNFVNELEKYTNAIFVGEPTAGRPNHYGDARAITLPNSKLNIRVSTVYWQDVDPRDTRPYTAPEISAELISEDYRKGFDRAMQAIIEYTPEMNFQELIKTAGKQTNLSDFIIKYRAFKNDSKNKYIETQISMNQFGYTLLQNKRIADAVKIFELNAEAYVNSANVYDSLGDALAAAGRRDEAIKSYEKALSTDPNFAPSVTSLRKLRGN